MSGPRGPQVDVDVSELLRKHNVPEAVPGYLLSFPTPIATLASVACLDESHDLLEQLLKDSEVAALPQVLATRSFFREAQAKYAASLVIVRTPSRARVLSLLACVSPAGKSVFWTAIPSPMRTLTRDGVRSMSFRKGLAFAFRCFRRRLAV